jgi:hypothetical protein
VTDVPASDTSRFLRAALRRDRDAAGPVVIADESVLRWLFYLLARQRFPDGDRAAITAYAREASQRRTLDVLAPRDALLAEASIRHILGEQHILDGLSPEKIGEIWTGVIFDLVETAGLSDADIDRLLADAERNAAQQEPLS